MKQKEKKVKTYKAYIITDYQLKQLNQWLMFIDGALWRMFYALLLIWISFIVALIFIYFHK